MIDEQGGASVIDTVQPEATPHDLPPRGVEAVVGERIEAGAIGPTHLRILMLCMLLTCFDGYDIASMGLAVPVIARDWGVSPGVFGGALAAVMIGSGSGGILLGWLGDRIGRKPMIIGSAFVVAFASMGASTADTVSHVFAWRILLGVGFGLGLPNVYAMVGDIIPSRRRAFCTTLLAASTSIGGMLGGLIAPTLVASFGWHSIFLFGGIGPLALGLLMPFMLRESPRVLAARGRFQHLPASLAAFGLDNSGLPKARDHRKIRRSSPIDLLRDGLLPISIFYLMGYLFCGFIYQILANWLPSLLTSSHWSAASAQRSVTLLYGGALVGGLMLSWIIDRLQSNGLLAPAIAFGIGSVLCLAVGIWYDSSILFPLLSALALAIGGGQYVLPAVAARLFPPKLLATALSFFGPLSRLGGITGSFVAGWLLLRGWSGQHILMVISLSPALCALVFVALSTVARRRQRAVLP